MGTYAPGTVLTYTGDSGAEAEWTVPPAADIHGTNLLESFIASGKIHVTGVVDPEGDEVDPDATTDADAGTDEPPTHTVPEGNMDAVIEWIRGGVPEGEDLPDDSWVERARAAQYAEAKSAKPRKTLVQLLTDIVQQVDRDNGDTLIPDTPGHSSVA